jgi:hypothetical protein
MSDEPHLSISPPEIPEFDRSGLVVAEWGWLSNNMFLRTNDEIHIQDFHFVFLWFYPTFLGCSDDDED